MEFKGTKGEWFACCLKAKPHFLFANDGYTTICVFKQQQDDGQDLPIEEVQANAKLIASAPELLEFVQSLINEREDIVHPEIVSQAKIIIEKATN